MSSAYKQEEIQCFIFLTEIGIFGGRINKASANFYCQNKDSVFCLNAVQKSTRLLACNKDLLCSHFYLHNSYNKEGKTCLVKPLFLMTKHGQEETWPHFTSIPWNTTWKWVTLSKPPTFTVIFSQDKLGLCVFVCSGHPGGVTHMKHP